MREHTVRSFEEELERLTGIIGEMGTLATRQLGSAIDAVVAGDAELADRLVAEDHEIDEREREACLCAVNLLALRQPMAIDLRETVAAIKISGDLERIADLAKNVAKRAHVLGARPPRRAFQRVERMSRAVLARLQLVVEAYVRHDAEAALEVWQGDEEIDDWYYGLFRELLTYMMEDPRTITVCTHLLFVAKNVERVGDHCANVASEVHYPVTGQPIPKPRPKGEDARLAVVEPPASEPS